MSNRGTEEGNLQEIEFVKDFNRNKKNILFHQYIKNLLILDIEKLFMVRVTTNQYSRLSEISVKTRADTYCIYVDDKFAILPILERNKFYLDEQVIEKYNIKHTKVLSSGISVKLWDSESFQILKLTPISFNSIFGNFELGAGASLYCLRENELHKNQNLLTGWHTNFNQMNKYFSKIVENDRLFYLNKEKCEKIKQFSISIITQIISSSEELQKKVFNGIGLYEEPYTAHYLFKANSLSPLKSIPFSVTTGSGRSNGNYTIVLKPK